MSKSEFDIGRAKILLEEISTNLAELPSDNAKYAQLRAEVDDLKLLLGGADAELPVIAQKMISMHTSFDRAAAELRADGFRAGMFLREIGRMLGLA